MEVPKVTITTFRSYYLTVMEYLNEEHWLSTETVAPLLSLQDKHCLCPFLQVEDINDDASRPYVESVFDDIIQMHIAANFYVSRGSYYQAYNLQLLIISLFSKEIVAKEKDSNWYLPLISVFCDDLRLLAKKAEYEDKRDLEPYMEDVANVIMGLYRICVADNRPDLRATKKAAIMPLTVELFRVYFDMNKMTLLKPLIRSVENLNSSFVKLVSLSDLVAYNYFLGKKAIFDGDMATANRALQHAFDYCPERFKTSRRNILIYWLPVKMFLGYIPNRAILNDFDLSAFFPIIDGIDHGDCKEFRHALAQHSRFFIKSGIFLMLEKLTNLTHLALFKRLHSIVNKDGGCRVKLDAFYHCLRYRGSLPQDG
uniref:PCI domain-containing protein n=2 Tax=Panagrellus redivivus TaxID=6233 RepID=A0A7E4V772_PANRE